MHEVIFDGTPDQFGDVFERVRSEGQPVVIRRPGQSAAIVVPLAEYQVLLDTVVGHPHQPTA